jgi:hypothetical protein
MTFQPSQILHHLIDLRQPAENGPSNLRHWLYSAWERGILTLRGQRWEMTNAGFAEGFRFIVAKNSDSVEEIFDFIVNEVLHEGDAATRIVDLVRLLRGDQCESIAADYMQYIIDRDHLDDFEQWQDEDAVARAHELAALAAKDRAA